MWFLLVLTLLIAVAALVIGLGLAGARWRERRRAGAGDLDALPEDVLGLRQEVAALRREAQGALRHLVIVRYDAFGDVGGHLSWSLAVADESGAGVVLTSITGRSEVRSYAKTLSGWSCETPLSPEESEAVQAARP
ncbi:MAG: DUF4446 family protein [Nocardioides sp.]|nr:DUF4446 family protein [Nocardioides sp.]